MPSDSETSTQSKVTYEQYDGPVKAVIDKYLPLYEDFVTVQPCGARMPGKYREYHDVYQKFNGRPTDVWVSSYPKAGTTWTQEVVWSLLFTLKNPRITDALTKRFPFFEWDGIFNDGFELEDLDDDDPNKKGVMWKILNESLPNPRAIKTHLHKQLLPPCIGQQKAKIVYVCRDPRDVCVSLYYHSVKLDGYTGSFDDLVKLFLNDALPWSPFWTHVLGYWNSTTHNVLFISYEDMKKDMENILIKMSKFLGIKREGCDVGTIPPTELKEIMQHVSFDQMSRNPAVNNEMLNSAAVASDKAKDLPFMRKGKVGDHKNHLSKEQLKQFKIWTEEALKGSDFPYYRDYE